MSVGEVGSSEGGWGGVAQRISPSGETVTPSGEAVAFGSAATLKETGSPVGALVAIW